MGKDYSQVISRLDIFIKDIQDSINDSDNELNANTKVLINNFMNQLFEIIELYKLSITQEKLEQFISEIILPEVNRKSSLIFHKKTFEFAEEVTKYSDETRNIIAEPSLDDDQKGQEFNNNYFVRSDSIDKISKLSNVYDVLVEEIKQLIFDSHFFDLNNIDLKMEIVSRIKHLSYEINDLHMNLSQQLYNKATNEIEEIAHLIRQIHDQEPNQIESKGIFY